MKKAPNNTLILLSGAIFILFNILAPSATFAQTGPIGGIVPCGDQKDANGIITNPCNLCHLYTGAKNIVDFMLFDLILPLAVVALLIGGIFLLASQGNPQMMETGKKAITNTVIGVIIAFGSWLIIATIVNTLGYKGFTAAWNEPPTCKESIAGTAPPPSTVEKFCVSKSKPCIPYQDKKECVDKCLDGTCQASCPAVKKFCVSPDGVKPPTCFDRGSEERCGETCHVGTCKTSCPDPTPSGKVTEDEARARLAAAGITVNHPPCPPGSDGNGCTTLAGMREATLQEIIDTKRACGCEVVVTGGTEPGHAPGSMSHANGFKVDLRPNSRLDSFITGTYVRDADGSSCGNRTPCYVDPRTNTTYVRESSPIHWDITVP